MSRRKRGEPSMNGSAAVLDPPTEVILEKSVEELVPAPAKTRPVISFAANSDRTTRLEVAVWARTVKVSETEEYTQYSITLARAWRDTEGNWTGNGFYRAHDIPVLLYLVEQAYQWCLQQRTHTRSIETDDDVPF